MENKGVKAFLGEKPIDQDVKRVLAIVDELLGELPANVVDMFSKTKDYELYRKVLDRYGVE
ncbi:MAG: hypothetical protein V1744_04725 [Candidatus Altiarchaeota archaeon]